MATDNMKALLQRRVNLRRRMHQRGVMLKGTAGALSDEKLDLLEIDLVGALIAQEEADPQPPGDAGFGG